MKFLFGLLLVGLVAAFATRPDARALDDMIVGELQVEASNLGVGDDDNILSGIAKLTCSINADECARLIRSAMTLEVGELYVARTASVSIGDDPAMSCIGVFTQWTCFPAD